MSKCCWRCCTNFICNPDLTQTQARQILESSTDKIANYSFSSNYSSHPNGTWNIYVGYGRINAHKAVLKTLSSMIEIDGPSELCDQSTFSIGNLPAGATVQWNSTNSNLTLLSGQGTSNAIFAKTGNGLCQITSIVSCGGSSFNPTPQTVSVGSPLRPYISNGSITSTYATVNYNLTLGQPTTSLQLFLVDQPNSAISTQWYVE